MPHVRQLLPGLLRCAAPIAFATIAACRNDGQLVILVDSRDAGASLDLVASPFDPANIRAERGQVSGPADSIARLKVLDDSVALLGGRFSTTRDSLNIAVRALDTADRRTPAYAARYADLRRRTVAAEGVRDARDAVQARANSLRTKLTKPPAQAGAPSATGAAAERRDGEGVRRHRVNGTTVTLTLEPGAWWVGLAVAGGQPAQFARRTIRSGATDTLRLGVRGAAAITVP